MSPSVRVSVLLRCSGRTQPRPSLFYSSGPDATEQTNKHEYRDRILPTWVGSPAVMTRGASINYIRCRSWGLGSYNFSPHPLSQACSGCDPTPMAVGYLPDSGSDLA
ncbi:hypothetical protein NDU88_000176 [Pleurodeles waltl]|uniref:Uncharacterized protein n=1 Tax=Pleurodeles waltl TaxID=8319 RepID=A0AAV7VSQ8_PLEWA|nr:hypothetical protein NDU88_000176 [Pleurodeles waltl]